MNKKFYIVFYPNFTLANSYEEEYKIAKKTFNNWKKAINFKKKREFYTGRNCSLIALHCNDNGIILTTAKRGQKWILKKSKKPKIYT